MGQDRISAQPETILNCLPSWSQGGLARHLRLLEVPIQPQTLCVISDRFNDNFNHPGGHS